MMKNLLPLACALVLALHLSPLSIDAQTRWDHNDGLLVTEGATGDTVILSWWGRMFHAYEIEVSDDLMLWAALPEVIEGFGAPIAWELDIPVNGNRWFMRVRKSPLPMAIASLFNEDSNLELLALDYIGTEDMRGTFSGGHADSLPIDSGWVFSTGRADRWNENKPELDHKMGMPGDLDLEHWMRSEGFGMDWLWPHPSQAFSTFDAAGLTFDFEVDPSIFSGEIELAFFFASDEYYQAPRVVNDAMGIFIFELDSHGEIVPESRVNIGVLPETESHSHGIVPGNAGSGSNGIEVNVEESGFLRNESGPPRSFGYSGFTGRLVGSGGAVNVYGDVNVKTRMRQANITDGAGHGDYGWGGLVLRGRHNEGHEFSGYAFAFGRDSGDLVFTAYKIENHETLERPDDTFWKAAIIPNENIEGFHSDTVTVLHSIEVTDFEFTEGEWYWIRAEVVGDTVRARFWEGDEGDEPGTWAIEVTDANDPLGDGFVGVVHLDTGSDVGQNGDPTDNSDLQWDFFEIDDGSVYSTDFGVYQTGKRIPAGWKTLGIGAREWDVIEDTGGAAGSIGGRYLQHDLVGENVVSILKYKGPETVEGGKRYRVKVVVADGDDRSWDSAIFLENGSIRIMPD